jgi:hypothetical protein
MAERRLSLMTPCPCRRSDPTVFMMESAEDDRSLQRRQCTLVTHRRDTCRFRSIHPVSVRYTPLTTRRPSPEAYVLTAVASKIRIN